ncbi:MAG: division/cell wall cluster transcriptional repressor MraZ [Bacteroidetes bacterium]|nr:division/cell wall cluster transcriptional repressor MraZ [Bacteroidota bacterium]
MVRFRSTYEHNIDSKGRLAIPAKMRAAGDLGPGSELIAAVFLDNCIKLFPVGEWEKLEDDLLSLDSSDPAVREATRKVIGSSQELELDGQARVVLSKALLDYANLSASSLALVVGVGSHMEVWNPETYQASGGSRSNEDLFGLVMSNRKASPAPLSVNLSYGSSAS